jgi:hypothetical protein
LTSKTNLTSGLKAGAVVNRFLHNDSQVALARRAVDWTFKYHGSMSGSILADELIKGLGPYYGQELCTTVESMFSLSYLYHALGDSDFADRAERTAFNALPAALMPDWWAHQYISQPNQPYSTDLEKNPWWNVNGLAQTFGLEPNYPCCTVNHPQGYPKFLVASWAKLGPDGLAHTLLSPSLLTETLDNGAKVSVDVETNYPFSDLLSYTIDASGPFKLHVRIPSWTDPGNTIVKIAGRMSGRATPDPHTRLHAIPLPAGSSKVTVIFRRSVNVVPRANESVSILHGPLLYTLDVGYDAQSGPTKQYNDRQPIDSPDEAHDWIITNTTKWNYAIDVKTITVVSNGQSYIQNQSGQDEDEDDEDDEDDGNDDIQRRIMTAAAHTKLANPIWAPGAPPTYLEVEGCEVIWPLYKSVPGFVPETRKCLGERTKLRFVPVGSAKIGMVELPIL